MGAKEFRVDELLPGNKRSSKKRNFLQNALPARKWGLQRFKA